MRTTISVSPAFANMCFNIWDPLMTQNCLLWRSHSKPRSFLRLQLLMLRHSESFRRPPDRCFTVRTCRVLEPLLDGLQRTSQMLPLCDGASSAVLPAITLLIIARQTKPEATGQCFWTLVCL